MNEWLIVGSRWKNEYAMNTIIIIIIKHDLLSALCQRLLECYLAASKTDFRTHDLSINRRIKIFSINQTSCIKYHQSSASFCIIGHIVCNTLGSAPVSRFLGRLIQSVIIHLCRTIAREKKKMQHAKCAKLTLWAA